MNYRGRFTLGDTVPLTCLCRDSSGAAAAPDRAPAALVFSGSALVASLRLPVSDRFAQPGVFVYPLVLDSRFAAGAYRVVYQWAVSGNPGAAAESFEVVAGGHPDGPGLALAYFRGPAADYVLVQGDGGRIVRRRNPRL